MFLQDLTLQNTSSDDFLCCSSRLVGLPVGLLPAGSLAWTRWGEYLRRHSGDQVRPRAKYQKSGE